MTTFHLEVVRAPTELQETPSRAGIRSRVLFDGHRFTSPWSTWINPTGAWRAIRWWFTSARCAVPLPPRKVIEEKLPIVDPNFISKKSIKDGFALTWIGHATCLIELDGISVLTDPVFGEYCSPPLVHFPSYRRVVRPVPCSIEDLPDNLRVVVISHNHHDHLEVDSIRRLINRFGGNSIKFCVPDGLGSWFRNNFNSLNPDSVLDFSWWDSAQFRHSVSDQIFTVTCAPIQHWSTRNFMCDKFKTLWGSWCIEGPSGRKFFFVGDSGYCSAFSEIGRELGPFDLAAIPIGAYEPRELLKPQHIDPQEAVKVHKDLNSKLSVAIHWGTFRLSSEDFVDGPRNELAKALVDNSIDSKQFLVLKHGETILVS